jgi:hypothetical protein
MHRRSMGIYSTGVLQLALAAARLQAVQQFCVASCSASATQAFSAASATRLLCDDLL